MSLLQKTVGAPTIANQRPKNDGFLWYHAISLTGTYGEQNGRVADIRRCLISLHIAGQDLFPGTNLAQVGAIFGDLQRYVTMLID
jgi:hypothetical protein